MSAFAWTVSSTPSTGTDNVQALLNIPGTTVWVGVGDNGLILRSLDDGVTWLLSRTSETNGWRDLDWNGTILTMVASNGVHRVATSTNHGATWTLQGAAEANSWQAIRWASALSLWVSVANSGVHRVQTSPDGAAWTARSASSATTWSALAVNPSSGLLLAVDTTSNTMTSPDGINWTGHTLSANHTITGQGNNRALWSSTLAAFVVPTVDNVSIRYLSSSTNGSTWTDASVGNTTGFGQVVSAPSLGGFIAPNGSSLSTIGYSMNGTQAWTIEDSTFGATWDTGNWNDSSRTVLFWDNSDSFQFLRGVRPRTLATVTPATGPVTGAQAVTMTGVGFAGATSVTFDGVAATSVVVVSDTSIMCVTPVHPAGAVPIVISGPTVTGPNWTITATGLYAYVLGQALLPPIPQPTPVLAGGQSGLISKGWVDWLTAVKQRIETAPQVAASQIVAPGALTAINDSNISLTLTGTPAGALLQPVTIKPGWIGHLPVTRGGTGIGVVTTGDLLYGSASQTLGNLAIGTTGQILEVVSGLPAWVSPGALTRVNDTNVTVTLGGTPATALLQAVSLTLGWTGQLALSRGGTAADLSGTGGTGQYVKQTTLGGAFTVGTIPASDITSGQALTSTSDTNVTLTLGGAPSSALLTAASITAGWSGTLSLTRGGTAANLSATGGAHQVLQQSSSGAAITVGQLAPTDISGNVVTGTGTSTRVAFWDTSSDISSDANLFWDNSNKRLGIGTASPSVTLDARANIAGGTSFGSSGIIANLFNTAGASKWATLHFSDNATSDQYIAYFSGTTQATSRIGIGGSAETLSIINSRVGVLSTNPPSPLHVLHDGGSSVAAGQGDQIRIDSGVSGHLATLHLTDNVTSDAFIDFVPSATASSRYLNFTTRSTLGDLAVFGSGGVAVGSTTDPGAGNFSTSGSATIGSTGNSVTSGNLVALTSFAFTNTNSKFNTSTDTLISTYVPSITAHSGGTGPTITGIDTSFAVVMNGATSVTVTFGNAFVNAPNLGVSYSAAGTTNQGIAVTNSTVVITGAGIAGTVFCIVLGSRH